MPEVRRLRNRGANIEVVAYGEVLFTEAGPVPGWLGRFSQRVRAAAELEAPSNKRPRWAHYGKPLKMTMRATTKARRGSSKFHLHAAVGSTAPHAYYVDQGTGVYNGSGPYPAAVLPPWQVGSPSLYEATWKPAGPSTANFQSRRVSPVMIKGQQGQFFFDKALKRGFQSMRMRSVQLPGEGVSGMSDVLRSVPAGLTGFLGNTPPSAGFRASLDEWREWRDSAWANYEGLGRGRGVGSRMSRRAIDMEIARRKRDAVRDFRRVAPTDEALKARQAAEAERMRAAQARQKLADERRKEAEAAERAATQQRILANRQREARALAQRYANAGYTGVGVNKLVDSNGVIRGYAVVFVSPSGEPGRTEFT